MSDSLPAPRSKLPAHFLRAAALALGGLTVLVAATGFIVRENEQAVVLRFGRPVATHTTAGWHWRAPFPIDRVQRLDTRLQQGELRLSEALTQDKRNVIVPMFYVWRVGDASRLLARVGPAPAAAAEKLDALLTSARNAALGRTPFESLVSLQAETGALAAFERGVADSVRADARDNLGIDLVDAGVLRVALPQANTEAVFRRMRAERLQEAARYRAEGRAQAETLRAETDKDTAILMAEARRYAEETRGRAEADAARIYATAHGADIAFYSFLRELQSLRTIVDRNTTLVLDTDSAPFRMLKDGPGLGLGSPASPLLPATAPAPRLAPVAPPAVVQFPAADRP
ncbi:MAG: protease modulator HflC [Burkholderiales bacterium]|nr:protease modulator HflC [Opitutaceae bacterium]